MDNQVNIKPDKKYSLAELQTKFIIAETAMRYPKQGKTSQIFQYKAADDVLNNYLPEYEKLSENEKKNLNVNTNELERIAVKTLVEQGHSDIISKERLKKFGYSPSWK